MHMVLVLGLRRLVIRLQVFVLHLKEILHQNHFPIPDEAVYTGLKHVDWQGRLQVLQDDPMVVVDVAHNIQGISTTMKAIKEIFPARKIYCVLGVLGDKKYKDMIDHLNQYVDYYITVTPNNERALPASTLADSIKTTHKPVLIGETIVEGLKIALALAQEHDLICVLGSHFIVGEIIKHYKKP